MLDALERSGVQAGSIIGQNSTHPRLRQEGAKERGGSCHHCVDVGEAVSFLELT